MNVNLVVHSTVQIITDTRLMLQCYQSDYVAKVTFMATSLLAGTTL